MGSACVSSMCNNDIEFEQVDMKISKKNCQTLERYGQGAAGRREAQKKRIQFIKNISRKYIFTTILKFSVKKI